MTLPHGKVNSTFPSGIHVTNLYETVAPARFHSGFFPDIFLNKFPNLERLICNNQNITGTLDLSKCPKLKFAYCNNNNIEIINLRGLKELESLYLGDNLVKRMEKLDDDEDSFVESVVGGIDNINLTETPTNLKHLECYHTLIQELKVKHLTKLGSLKCYNCWLYKLDVSGLKNLKELFCSNIIILTQKMKSM